MRASEMELSEDREQQQQRLAPTAEFCLCVAAFKTALETLDKMLRTSHTVDVYSQSLQMQMHCADFGS